MPRNAGPTCRGILDRLRAEYATGHAYDSETGLTYMQARFYDAQVGRFLSGDPEPFRETDPFTFNRYSYANNNPYAFTDPTGMAGCEAPTGSHICGGGGGISSTPVSGDGQRQAAASNKAQSAQMAGMGRMAQVASQGLAGASGGAAVSAGTTAGELSGAGWLTEALAALSRVTPYLGAALLAGDTPQSDMYRHYGYAAQAPNFAGGLFPGSFATTAQGPPMTGIQAQQLLALPHALPPDAYFNVMVSRSTPVIGPTLVLPEFGQPGGGIQYKFPEGTPPGSVFGPFSIPPQ